MSTSHPTTMSRKALQIYDQHGETAMLHYLNQRCTRIQEAPGLRAWVNQEERDDSVSREGATYSFSRTQRLAGDPEESRPATMGINLMPTPFDRAIPLVTWPTSQDILDGARIDLEQKSVGHLVTEELRRAHPPDWPWTNGLPMVPEYVALAQAPSLARLAEEETRAHQGPPRQHAVERAARDAALAIAARLPKHEAQALSHQAREWLNRLTAE